MGSPAFTDRFVDYVTRDSYFPEYSTTPDGLSCTEGDIFYVDYIVGMSETRILSRGEYIMVLVSFIRLKTAYLRKSYKFCSGESLVILFLLSSRVPCVFYWPCIPC